MKNVLSIVALFFSSMVFGQKQSVDSIPQVIYSYPGDYAEPAYFINGSLVSKSILTTLNPAMIDSMSVLNGNIKIDSIAYHGQIIIRTKNSYCPAIVSLTDLKKKYTDLKSAPTIFLIDGEIINANYEKYMVDEKNILEIIVTKVDNTNENINMSIVSLQTKSKDNIKKSQQIFIRGKEAAYNYKIITSKQ